MENYYKSELSRINTKGEYPPMFKITSEDGKTKWLNINNESARELALWLIENYRFLIP